MREWRCCDAIFRVWEPLYRKWDMQTILTQPRALSPILQWLSSFLPGSTNYFKTAAQMDRENVSPCLLARSVWRCPWWWHHSPSSIPSDPGDSAWSLVVPPQYLKAKDGDILGSVVKLAYIGLHHHCILKTCPHPVTTLLNPVKCSGTNELFLILMDVCKNPILRF